MSQYMKLQNMVVGRVFQLWNYFFLNHKDKLIQAKKWTAPVPELLFEKLRDNEKYILRLSDLYLVNK